MGSALKIKDFFLPLWVAFAVFGGGTGDLRNFVRTETTFAADAPLPEVLVEPSCAAALNPPRAALTQALADHAFAYDLDRVAAHREFWKRYKNDWQFAQWVDADAEFKSPEDSLARAAKIGDLSAVAGSRQKGRVVDLDQMTPKYLLPHVKLRHPFGPEMAPGDYETLVINLRAGDTLVVDGAQFHLGEFLGAGNATHVYALADRPNEVIRLPFIADSVAEGFGDTLRETGQYMIRNFATLIRPRPPARAVKITQTGSRYQYVVVSRIHGNMNGEDFLGKLPHDAKKISAQDRKRYAELKVAVDHSNFEELPELEVFCRADDEDRAAYGRLARQTVFDTREKSWIVADWENDM